MDTTGHHSIAHEVGEAFLQKAISDANHKGKDGKPFRITAFYMGNWLTDVSQPVDPRAYRGAAKGINTLLAQMADLFDRMVHDAPSWVREAASFVVDLDRVRTNIRDAQKSIEKGLRAWLEMGEKGELAKKFKLVYSFLGYVKFVLDDKGKPTKMEKAVFDGIINVDYTQYFPHEHLDRPAVGENAQKDDIFAAKKADHPLSKRIHFPPQTTDLYKYLRNSIKVAAGHFASLDGVAPPDGKKVSWAIGTFHPGYTEFTDPDGKQQPVSDDNLAWNLGLAKLGHALHAVEDFYAHSTFVEHAMPGVPKTYNQVQRWVDSSHLLGTEVLARRLKEWKDGIKDDDWKGLVDDPCVVTGYFDTRDTIISLLHACAELFHWPTDPPDKEIDDLLEYDYVKALTDTLDFVSDPKTIWNDPANDPDQPGYSEKKANAVVAKLKKKNERDLTLVAGDNKMLNAAITTALEQTKMKDLPADVKQNFENAVRELGQVVGAVSLGKTIYGTIKDVALLILDPLAWVGKFMPKFVWDHLKEYGKVYLRRLLENYIGSLRIGCHSLLAKDTGPELLHDAAMDCAKAVHWYVMYQMGRHGRDSMKALVARGTDGRKEQNPITLFQGIDWLELLEYYLAHPFATVGVSSATIPVPASIIHVTAPGGGGMSSDTIGKLGKKYAKTALLPPDVKKRMKQEGLEFWELISDENFPTRGMSREARQRTINRVLAHQGTGLQVSDHVNYAFKPGLRLIIPYQRAELPAVNVPDGKRLWWQPVILQGWDVISKWYAEDRKLGTAPDRLHVRIPVPWSEQKSFVDDVAAYRKKLEQAYNSTGPLSSSPMED